MNKPDQHAEYVAPPKPTVGSLFSGIGGIDLGLERAGWRVIWQSEMDPYGSKILAKHWPEVPNLGDITRVDWSTVERPDLVAGGFPCQPVSLAGRGRAQLDARWLWPEFGRCVRLLRPSYVLVENVPGLLVRGMGDVLGDLAALGYDCEWTGIPAAAVGAPHLRWRVFTVGYADRQRVPILDVRTVDPPGGRWDPEPNLGRVVDGLPSGMDRERLRCLGNAVVPQVAEYVGRQLARHIDGDVRAEHPHITRKENDA